MSVKISYVNGEKKSSVVILKDGTVMEVRRDTKTKWAPGEVRGCWPSIAAWAASLPREWASVEKWIKSGNRPDFSGSGSLLSPGLSYFMGQERATVEEVEAALDSYFCSHGLLFRQPWLNNAVTDSVILDDFLATLTSLTPGIYHLRTDILKKLVTRNIPSALVEEEEESGFPVGSEEEEAEADADAEVPVVLGIPIIPPPQEGVTPLYRALVVTETLVNYLNIPKERQIAFAAAFMELYSEHSV
jgi:hypothetical protein